MFNSRLRVKGRKRWFSNTIPWCHTSLYHENYVCSVSECYRISIAFKIVWMGENFEYVTCGKVFFRDRDMFPFSKTHSFFLTEYIL